MYLVWLQSKLQPQNGTCDSPRLQEQDQDLDYLIRKWSLTVSSATNTEFPIRLAIQSKRSQEKEKLGRKRPDKQNKTDLLRKRNYSREK